MLVQAPAKENDLKVKRGSPLYNQLVAQGEIKKHSKYNVNNSAKGKEERTLDGITFPSKSEMYRYALLKQCEQAGIIKDLELHPQFDIIPVFAREDGRKERGAVYTADFLYVFNGDTVIEEVKGSKKMDSRDFVLRKKLFLLQNPDLVYFIIRPPYIKTWPPKEN